MDFQGHHRRAEVHTDHRQHFEIRAGFSCYYMQYDDTIDSIRWRLVTTTSAFFKLSEMKSTKNGVDDSKGAVTDGDKSTFVSECR
jgi:hypothetical protein